MTKFFIGAGIIAFIVLVSIFGLKVRDSGLIIQNDGERVGEVAQGTGNPEGWPEDAPPPYEMAPILYSHKNDGLGAVYNVSAPREEVVGYYVDQLEAFGWTVSVPNLPGDTIVIIAEKDIRRFDVYLIAADDVTAVTTGILFNESATSTEN